MSEFHDHENDGEDYNAICRWSIAAVILGPFSVTAMVHPIFWAIPVAGAIAAIMGLVNTRHSGVAGRSLAILGLCLTLFFSGCAQSRYMMRRRLVFNQARIHATKWMNLVSDGKLYRAHQLLLPPIRRASPDQSLTEHYSNDPNAKQEADTYFRKVPLRDLVSHGKDGKITFVRNLSHSRYKLEDTVEQLYHLKYEMDGKQEVVPFHTRLMRRYDYEKNQCHWEFLGVIVSGQK